LERETSRTAERGGDKRINGDSQVTKRRVVDGKAEDEMVWRSTAQVQNVVAVAGVGGGARGFGGSSSRSFQEEAEGEKTVYYVGEEAKKSIKQRGRRRTLNDNL
jgi:hypothetical protein